MLLYKGEENETLIKKNGKDHAKGQSPEDA
jgi:hypothetical protein